MNKLAIAKKMNRLAGTQGTIESTTNSTDEYHQVLVEFLDTAYNDIQLLRKKWKFMNLLVEPTILASGPTYTNTDIKSVKRVIYNLKPIRFVEYDDWLLTEHAEGPPTEYTTDPATGVITFNPLDATSYGVKIQYRRTPHIMTSDFDNPIIPLSFHNVIVWKGLMELGVYFGNWDLISNYTDKYSIEIGQLLRDQVPSEKITTGPIA